MARSGGCAKSTTAVATDHSTAASPLDFQPFSFGKRLAFVADGKEEIRNENQVTCAVLTGGQFDVRGSVCRGPSGSARARILCCGAPAATASYLCASAAGPWACLGWRLLASSRASLALAARLLGEAAFSARLLGGAAISAASLLSGLLAAWPALTSEANPGGR